MKSQYGDPTCTRLDGSGALDIAATLACLQQPDRRGTTALGSCDVTTGLCLTGRKGNPCVADADCNAFSLQLHLLSSGVCGVGGACTGGRVGAPCAVDTDCAIVARAYEIPRNLTQAIPFFQDQLIPDKIRELTCPSVP